MYMREQRRSVPGKPVPENCMRKGGYDPGDTGACRADGGPRIGTREVDRERETVGPSQ